MSFVHRARRALALLAAFAFVAFAPGVQAQDIPASHLKAARQAIDAINATDAYDTIIPQAVQALTQELIQQNPDLQELIIATVREKAILLTARRADLEREAAIIYAKVFTETDLNAITAFYTSEAGRKLLTNGATVAREVAKAGEIWKNGIARDLAEEVGKHLEQVVNIKPKPDAGGAPAPDGAAPAPEGAAPAEGAAVPAQ
jgi:hypothetical protein